MSGNVANAEGEDKAGLFSRLREGLSKTRGKFTEGVQRAFLGEKVINEDILEELETILLTSDVGVAATQEILDHLTKQVSRKELDDGKAVYRSLKDELVDILRPVEIPLTIDPTHNGHPDLQVTR